MKKVYDINEERDRLLAEYLADVHAMIDVQALNAESVVMIVVEGGVPQVVAPEHLSHIELVGILETAKLRLAFEEEMGE